MTCAHLRGGRGAWLAAELVTMARDGPTLAREDESFMAHAPPQRLGGTAALHTWRRACRCQLA